MHAVLNLETDGTVAENDKTFEERLGETCASCFFVHNYRAKLLFIFDYKYLCNRMYGEEHT